MPITIGGVQCDMVSESYTCTALDVDGERILHVLPENEGVVMNGLVGNIADLVAGRSGGQVLGHPWELPSGATIYCNWARVEGADTLTDNESGIGSYQMKRIRAVYHSVGGTSGGTGEIRTVRWDYSSSGVYKVVRDENGKPYVDSSMVSIIRLTISRQNISAVPSAAIYAVQDCVNKGPFCGAAEGTLLFRGPHIIERVLPSGSGRFDVHLVFDKRKEDWNKLWDEDKREFIMIPVGGGKAYEGHPYANFNLLLS